MTDSRTDDLLDRELALANALPYPQNIEHFGNAVDLSPMDSKWLQNILTAYPPPATAPHDVLGLSRYVRSEMHRLDELVKAIRDYGPGGQKRKDQRFKAHYLWLGPVRPGTGVPMLHRFMGHKNVSALRVLWVKENHDSLPSGTKMRRLQECVYPMCINPRCFTVAVPMQPAELPDYYAQPERISRTIINREETRWWKVAALDGVQDRYYYKGETYDVRCTCGCGEILRLPVCPAMHIQNAEWARTPDGVAEMMGRQYRCSICTRLTSAARKLRGSRPRAGFKPASAQHNNFEQELAQFHEKWDAGEVIGPGAPVSEDEREMQEMERAFREMPVEPDD